MYMPPKAHFALAKPAALIGSVRADMQDPAVILAKLNEAFEAFKAENDARIKALDKRMGDGVQADKVDRINTDITALNKALDEINAALAANRLGSGAGGGLSAEQREHAQAFEKFFRKGVDAGLSDLEVKAKLTSQSEPDGGYLVPTEVSQTIDRVLGTTSIMRQLATVMPIGTDEYKKIVNMGGASAGWVGEEESRPETSTPKLRELLFSVMELYANPFTTQKMLDDGIVDIAAWLADEVNIAFAEQEGAAHINGDGNRKPRGILQYDVVDNDNYAWGKIGYKVTGAAGDFVTPTASASPADALISLYYALKAGYRNNASWLMSDPVQEKVRKFKDADGKYLWAAPSESAEVATILRKPVYSDDNMPGVSAGKFPIAFGDFKRAYLILDRLGIRVLRDPFTNKPYVGFYTTKRTGGGVANFEALKLLKVAAS